MKKIISFLLSLVMVIGFTAGITTTAFAASDSGDVSFNVTYHETKAREMLDMINEFRNEDPTFTLSSGATYNISAALGNFKYDYGLEKIAMERAAELVLNFSHTRPNGTSWSTTVPSGTTEIFSENIGANFSDISATSQMIFDAWREDNMTYDEQVHRRNMLGGYYESNGTVSNYGFKYIGIACCEYDGTYYWVQSLSTGAVDSTYASPNNSTASVTVNTSADNLKLNMSTKSYYLNVGESISPAFSGTYTISDGYRDSMDPIAVEVSAAGWTISNKNVISISSGGTITGRAAGTAVVSLSAGGTTYSFTVTVTGSSANSNSSSSSSGSSSSTSSGTSSVLSKGSTFTSGSLKYKVTASKQVVVTGASSKSGTSIKIPNTLPKSGVTYTVVGIADNAFKNYTKLKTVTIGSKVTSIGSSAFYGCTALTKVSIPSSVTALGQKVFARCTALTKVTGCFGVTKIDKFAFYGCIELASVAGCSNATSIGAKAFARCTSLTQVGTDAGVTTLTKLKAIGSFAFYNCTSLAKVKIPSGVTDIKLKTFVRCTSLKSVSGCSGVTNIANYAFYKCTKLASVNGMTKLTDLGDKAFAYCSKLVRIGSTAGTVTLPAAETIGAYAFYNCTGMTTVKVTSASLTAVGQAAFRGCTSLKIFSESSKKLNFIGKQAFYEDSKLSSITLKSTKLTTKNVGAQAFKGIKSTAVFKIPSGKGTSYKKIFKAAGASGKITVKKA